MGVVFFFNFQGLFEDFVMFANVDMCKTVLIAAESTDSAAIFIELLKFFFVKCSLLFSECMCISGDVSGAQ